MKNDREERAELSELAERLAAETGCFVWALEPMAAHTSFRIGGPADLFVVAPGEKELARLLPALDQSGRPWVAVGNGTNLLVADEGYRGIVVRLGEGFRQLSRSAQGLVAGGALPLPALARGAVDAGLAGAEFLSGIPGTVGGAVRMNAGAWGASLSDILVSVATCRSDGREGVYLPAELDFGYRRSRLTGTGEVVTRIEVALHPGEREEIRRRTAELLAARKRSQPSGPSAGSVFKNPPGGKAGKLLEEVGAKGLRFGGAQVSEVHANFIINTGGATAADVLSLMRELQRRVNERFGILLEPEIRFLGGKP
ncbi:MAG TPA: UDP-N-acetylmuramate dehydrogenase [Firmicutes bacterium]|nr:UDP-N-acetylmuramate dehydrogenase [Bacillota bacterium]